MKVSTVLESVRRSRRSLVSLGLSLLVVTAPFWEVVVGRRTTMYGDVNNFNVPAYIEVWRTIKAGNWPWWTANVFAGHSMVGSGQYAVFYPLNVVFGLFDPVTAYRWWVLGHIWLAVAGAFAWSWHRWRSRPGAAVSAIAYGLNGFLLLHLVHPAFIATVAWLPFVFLGIDLLQRRGSWSRAAIVAVPLGMIGLLGQPQLLWIAVLGSGAYAATLALANRDRGTVLRASGAIACGLALSAIQWIPQFLFSRTSVRPDLSLDTAFEGSLLPRHLLTFLFPYPFGGGSQDTPFASPWMGGGLFPEVSSYVGVVAIALAVAGFVVLRRTPAALALAVMVVLGLLVSLGDSTPLGAIFHGTLPGAQLFRHWGRTMLLANLGLAILAGAGVRELLRRPRTAAVSFGLGAVGLGVVAATLPAWGSLGETLAAGSAGTWSRALPVVLLLALGAALFGATFRRVVAAGAIVTLCAVDLFLFASSAPWRDLAIGPSQARSFYEENREPLFGRPFDAPGGVDRWASSWYGFRSDSLVMDLRGINGYDPLIQRDWADTAGGWLYDGFPTRQDLWDPGWTADVLRVTTLVLQEDIDASDAGWTRDGPVPGLDFVRWIRSPRLPAAQLVGAVEVASLDEVRERLRDPATDLHGVAYVETPPVGPEFNEPGPAGTVADADVIQTGKVVVEADRPALLVLSHSWQRGWHARIDGEPAVVVRANGLVLGIAVPPGRHVIDVWFVPPGLALGSVLALLALGALFAPLLRGRQVSDRPRRLDAAREPPWTPGHDPV